jgi:hypothetical protein
MTVFRAGWLLAILLLCGCAPTIVAPEQVQTMRRVAVISAIGDKFTVKKIGMTVFGNDENEFPIDAWRIDEFVVSKVRGVLAGRFEVRPVAYQRSTDPNNTTPVKMVESVRAQSGAADIDAYIVVTKSGGPYGTSNQSLHGLGIVETSGLAAAVYVYALYQVTVVDGRNSAVIATTSAIPLSQMLVSFESIPGPSRKVDQSWMPAAFDATQSVQLKGAITELLDRNLPGTIASLKLLQ